MLEDSKTNITEKFDIALLQKRLFKILIFILPLAIFPFPWDWTERAMSLLILSISTLILGLEIIKLLWKGKTSILKSSMDIGFFLILGSMLLSTLFSVDAYTSLWGIDGRLGSGLIVFIAILLVTIVSRSFIEGEEDIRSLILFFLIGFFINNFLSLLSFFGINIWGLIPVYRNLYQVGLPLLRSSKVHLLVNFVSIILCIGFIGEYLIEGKRQLEYIFSIFIGLLAIINIWLYSMNQSLTLVLFFIILIGILLFIVLRTLKIDKETSKQILLLSLIVIFLIAIPVIFLQVERVRNAFFSEDFQMFTEIGLGFDISWIITGSVIVSGLMGGLFGLGLGTYSVAYHMFKPLDAGLLALGDATFHSGANEVLTRLASGGLLWFLIWLFLGYLVIKAFVQDLQSINKVSDRAGAWRYLIIDVVILTIFLSSFLLSYSVLVTFLLLAFVSLRAIIREYLKTSAEDKFVLKFWALNISEAPKGNSSLYSFNIFLTVVVSLISLFFLTLLGARAIASFNVLRAESFIVQENRKYTGEDASAPTMEERETFLESLDSYYQSALNLGGKNPLYNRKRAVIQLEKISTLVERFSEEDEEETELRDQYIDAITVLKGGAIDLARKSTETSPSVYANWLTRSTIYTGLVGIGFNEHVSDSLSSLEKAARLNPNNFELYYSMAQVYIVKDEQENALQLLSKVLEINPQHIPSIVLAAGIYKEEGNIELYASYLQAARQILEEQELTDLEIYQEIIDAINALEEEGFDLEQVSETELGEGELEEGELGDLEGEPLETGLEEEEEGLL
jgi:tetratricopeptide (TPR) repeat protein